MVLWSEENGPKKYHFRGGQTICTEPLGSNPSGGGTFPFDYIYPFFPRRTARGEGTGEGRGEGEWRGPHRLGAEDPVLTEDAQEQRPGQQGPDDLWPIDKDPTKN